MVNERRVEEPVAIIDLGTNTLILLVVSVQPDFTFTLLHDEACVVRLGEGINKNKKFLPAAMDRAFSALAHFKTVIDQQTCKRVIAIGTAGFRNATNAPEFIERVKNELQIPITVISGEHEAELIYAATKRDFQNLTPPQLTVDIGGGSTEFIFDDGKTFAAKSIPFGSVKLTEQFLTNDPPTSEEIQRLDNHIFEHLKKMTQELSTTPSAQSGTKPTIIATAGTATTLAAMHQHLNIYDPKKVHQSQLSQLELKKIAALLAAMPIRERQQLPGLTPLRADVIVAGARLLLAIATYFDTETLWISDRGLRYGILYNLLDGHWPT